MHRSSLLLLALLVSLSLTGPAGAAGNKAGDAAPGKGLPEITIFFSNDVRGETEPCG